jgi:hypothetical protein
MDFKGQKNTGHTLTTVIGSENRMKKFSPLLKPLSAPTSKFFAPALKG